MPVVSSLVTDVIESTDSFPSANRQRRFSGIARLYGADPLAEFERARIAVIGIGGVGSWTAEALARSAVGHLTLMDLDHLVESNTNRQIHALDGNYGKAKVVAMAERIALINPHCQIDPIDNFISPDNLDQLLGTGFDFIVDAIDSMRAKTALIAWCAAHNQPLITVGSAGGQIDPTRIRIDDLARTVQDPLLARVRARLRKQHGFARGPKAKFKVPAVYSDEALNYPPTATGELTPAGNRSTLSDRAQIRSAGLHCAGLGSSVCVTASFGFAAAAYVLQSLGTRNQKTGPRACSHLKRACE